MLLSFITPIRDVLHDCQGFGRHRNTNRNDLSDFSNM